jgi:transcriptional regulator with XRE-family HTH domain
MDIEKIGKQIAALRRERGLTQESLAEALDVSPQAVSKWENGHSLPETALLPGLARVLDTSIDVLLTDNKIQILSAFYGDGLESHAVTSRLNRLLQNNMLDLTVNGVTLGCPLTNNRRKFLILKYKIEQQVFYDFTGESARLTLSLDSRGHTPPSDTAEIIAAYYGTAATGSDVMQKLEHYKVFGWTEFRADHKLFPSDPMNDDKDYLTFIYLNRDGIHMVTCEEGESIAYSADKTELCRTQPRNEHFIPGVPVLPPFGAGMECSWAASLTAALQAMNVKATYTHVMGVSGACYRLAFCSPMWDYSSVDGLVAYDYAAPGYKAFGYVPKCIGRVDKENRAAERRQILSELRRNMPVLGINLRITHEWGVICGYGDGGADLFCRTKYDADILNSPDFVPGRLNAYDYLLVDNWPFIMIYFGDATSPPSDRENLMNSLRVFIDGAQQPDSRGYAVGLRAYDVWGSDLLDDDWYKNSDDAQLARRFSVNQFCALALYDARQAAYHYLSDSISLLPEKEAGMRGIVGLFREIAGKAEQAHLILDSKVPLDGPGARRFWTAELRKHQAALLREMAEAEQKALLLAEQLVK